MKRIYADHAATTPLSKRALESMMPFLSADYANASQPYSFAREGRKAIASARETIAEIIGASPEEIYFTSGGTEGDNHAVKGPFFASGFHGNVVVSAIEHHAVLRSAETLERFGVEKRMIPVSSTGLILPDQVARICDGRTRLVSTMLVNNEVGTIEPVAEIASVAHAQGALCHTDAVQAVGHMSIDVEDLGIDLLTASAHKFNGPKGIGFLYVRKGIPVAAYMNGGAQEGGLRAGTENVAGIVGMATALVENAEAMTTNLNSRQTLEDGLLLRLKESQVEFTLLGAAFHLPGLLSISFDNHSGESLLHRLDLRGISVSTGSACDSRQTQISHVLLAMQVSEPRARGVIRISLDKDNTLDEINALAHELIKITRDARLKILV